MNYSRVHPVPLPAESRMAILYPGAQLADAFAVALPPNATSDITELAQAVLANLAPWARSLMSARDTIVSSLGTQDFHADRRPGGRHQHGTDRFLSAAIALRA